MAYIATSEGNKAFNPHPHTHMGEKKHDFSPYDWNGGVIVSLCGEGYAILACDTRLATGYSIKSRDIERTFQLSSKTLIAAGGCHADVVAFYNNLKYRATMYEFTHKKEMSTEAVAQLVSNTLYYKRFFPYYSLPIVCGLDLEGNGYCANYDAVGSYIRCVDDYTTNGGSGSLVMPILDNLLGTRGVTSGVMEADPEKKGRLRKKKIDMSMEEAVEIIKSVYIGVAERDIMCGDRVVISKITKNGIEREEFDLKRD